MVTSGWYIFRWVNKAASFNVVIRLNREVDVVVKATKTSKTNQRTSYQHQHLTKSSHWDKFPRKHLNFKSITIHSFLDQLCGFAYIDRNFNGSNQIHGHADDLILSTGLKMMWICLVVRLRVLRVPRSSHEGRFHFRSCTKVHIPWITNHLRQRYHQWWLREETYRSRHTKRRGLIYGPEWRQQWVVLWRQQKVTDKCKATEMKSSFNFSSKNILGCKGTRLFFYW